MIEAALTETIIGAAMEVHRYWGPGLYEEIYELSLCHELQLRGVPHKTQVLLPIEYKGTQIGDSLRLDVLVPGRVVVELKATKALDTAHEAQLLTYMRLTKCPVGLLINFNVSVLKHGIKRMVISKPEPPRE